MLDEELRRDYAGYRIERAKEDLDDAYLLYEHESYRSANNRAYYSIFHALRSELILDGLDPSKHSGVIAEFRRRYIKEGLFPVEMSKMIGSAFTVRQASDYDDLFPVSRESSKAQIAHADYVYRLIRKYVEDRIR